MKFKFISTIIMGASFVLIASCSKESLPENQNNNDEILAGHSGWAKTKKPEVYRAFGDKSKVEQGLEAFRKVIGGSLNLEPGAVAGRREINWENVPAELTNIDDFPGNFFAAVGSALPNERKLGIHLIPVLNFSFSFRISDNNFSDVDPSYANEFPSFSPGKSFSQAYGKETEVIFKVPGSHTRAYVESFGIVFIDVDRNHAATLEFFDEKDNSLGAFRAIPAKMGGKYSFLGVRMPGKKIVRVVINSGTGVLAQGSLDLSQGSMLDLVTMDDIIYSEPKSLGQF